MCTAGPRHKLQPSLIGVCAREFLYPALSDLSSKRGFLCLLAFDSPDFFTRGTTLVLECHETGCLCFEHLDTCAWL